MNTGFEVVGAGKGEEWERLELELDLFQRKRSSRGGVDAWFLFLNLGVERYGCVISSIITH